MKAGPKAGNSCGSRKAFLSLFSFYYGRSLPVSSKADFIVIAPTYWGRGNLPNLDLAERLVLEGKAVLILEEALNPRLDYTEGAAQEKLKKIIEKGGEVIKDLSTYFLPLLLKLPLQQSNKEPLTPDFLLLCSPPSVIPEIQARIHLPLSSCLKFSEHHPLPPSFQKSFIRIKC